MRRGLLPNLLLVMLQTLGATNGLAQQNFAYSVTLNNVTRPGFYKIVLQPQVVARCRNGLNDIRILDGKGRQVPYILKADPQQFRESSFIDWPVISVTRQPDKQTHVVIGNTANRTVSELLLVIRNADAERTVTISGSDDNRQWFVIKENILLANLYSSFGDRFIQSLSFPASTYRYFKVIINGKDLLPVNIVKAGISDLSSRQGSYLPVPGPAIVQKDSADKASYVSLLFREPYQVDKLELTLEGVHFYHRTFSIHTGNAMAIPVASDLVLRSGAAPVYQVDVQARQLTLVVQNEDNPPLQVTGVKAYQLNRYLLSYLEPASHYQLTFGDSTTPAPQYDLEAFKDSIGSNAPVVATGAVVSNGPATAPVQQAKNNRTVFLWGIILSVLALLLALTLRMTKEINKKS